MLTRWRRSRLPPGLFLGVFGLGCLAHATGRGAGDPGKELTPDSLLPFLKKEFRLVLPREAKVQKFAAYTGRDVYTRRRPTREAFAHITLSPEGYKRFRKQFLYDDPRPEGQRLAWEGKERPPMIGFIPGP